MSYFDFNRGDLTDDKIDQILILNLLNRFFSLCVVMILGMLGGISYIFYWAFSELSLEWSCRQQYGVGWQAEFQKYHGSLSHAHAQIAICVVSLLSLTAILIWLCGKIFRWHFKKRHHHG
jgi:hypothetical protein